MEPDETVKEPEGEVKPEGDVKPQEDQAGKIAQLEAEKAELHRIATGAAREAEASKLYVQQLTSRLTEAAERYVPPNPNGEPPPSLADRMQTDPMRVLDEHFQARTAPLVAGVAEGMARQNRELFRLQGGAAKLYDDPKTGKPVTIWDKYGEEVDTFMKDFAADARANSGAYEAALGFVRGKHVDEELAERETARRETEKRSFSEGATAGGAGRPVKAVLSDLQKEVAKGLGISEEDYMTFSQQGGQA